MIRMMIRFGLFATVTILLTFAAERTAGQSPDQSWSSPKTIYTEIQGEYTNELWALSDRADTLYLWWPVFPTEGNYLSLQQIRSQSAVFHTMWHDGVWERPRDVLVWPSAGNNLLAAVMDSRGTIHAFSPTDCLSYTTVNRSLSMDPKAWSSSSCIDSTGASNVAVAIDPNERIYLTYATEGTRAIRIAISQNYGVDWRSYEVATTMQYEGPADGYFTDPDIVVDQRGRIHVVWSPATPPSGYPLLGTLYARSEDGGRTWTLPLQLAKEREGQPTLATYQNEVHVLWNGDASNPGRFYRYSPDGGATWREIEKLGDGGGLQRKPALIVDNRGNLHVMLHEQETLYYLTKTGGRWSMKQPLYSAHERDAVEVFTIRLAITGGDQLHAFYTLMTKQNPNGRAIYHQVRKIDAVYVQPEPMQAILTLPTVTPEPTVSLHPTDAGLPANTISQLAPPRAKPTSPVEPLGIVIIVSTLMVGSVILLAKVQRQY